MSDTTDARELKGERTRQRLLVAALSVFGTLGYDGVSTREIARAAGANQAAILYHFGGKEQLYVAVAEHVAAHGRQTVGAMHQLARPLGKRAQNGEAAVAALSAAVASMVRGLLDLSSDGAAAAFVLREQTRPGPGFDVLYEGYLRAAHEHISALVALATGRRARAVATILDAHAIIGMALGFAVARETLLRRAGWTTYTPARVRQIAQRVAVLAVRALMDPGVAQ